MSPRQRTYRFADGHQPWPAWAARPIITAKSRRRRPGMRRSARCEPAQRRGRVTSAPAPSCRYTPWGPVIRRDRLAVTDGPSSGQAALTNGASRGTGQAPARRPATGGTVPGPGHSAHGQAAHTLAAQITPAGGTAPATGAGLRRPQAPSQLIQAAAEAPGPGGCAAPASNAGLSHLQPPGGHHHRPARPDAGGEPARPVPAGPVHGGSMPERRPAGPCSSPGPPRSPAASSARIMRRPRPGSTH